VVDGLHSRKAVERSSISAHDRALGSGRGRCDDEIVSVTGPASPTHSDEQARVVGGDGLVVRQDRDRGRDLVDVRLTTGPPARRCELDADGELGEGDRCDRDVVVVSNELVEVGSMWATALPGV
jgi:hypothetical protein